MRTILLFIITFLFFGVASAQLPADRILGIYLTDEKDAKVEIFKKGNKYFGKTIWIKSKNNIDSRTLLDKNNPNKSLRTRHLLGLVFLTDLIYEDGVWVDGEIYAPKEGLYVNGEFKFLSNGDLELKASYFLISQTRVWKRLQ